jgi:hypothetical protein
MSSVFPLTYRVSTATRVTWVALGVIAVVGGGAGMTFSLLSGAGILAFLLIGGFCLVFVLMGVWLIVGTIRSKVVLHEEAIEVHGAVLMRRLDRAGILGRRNVSTNGHCTIQLLPRPPGKKKFELLPSLKTDAAFDNWLVRIPDLDAKEAQASEAAVLADPNFGMTPTERLARLGRGKRVAQWMTWATLVAGLWGIVYPHPYGIVLTVVAALPWIVLAIVVYSRGLYRLDGMPNEVNPQFAHAFLFPGMALMVRGVFDVSVLDWQKALLLALLGGVVIAFVVRSLVPHIRKLPWSAPSIGALMSCYAYGAIVLANVHLDTSEPTVFQTTVVDKRVTSGKFGSYKLKLDAWGERTELKKYPLRTRYITRWPKERSLRVSHAGRIGDWMV